MDIIVTQSVASCSLKIRPVLFTDVTSCCDFMFEISPLYIVGGVLELIVSVPDRLRF